MNDKNKIENLVHRLNNMIDLQKHRETGNSLYAIRKERIKKENIVNNNRKQ
tara:strand:+ start:466 stop:618 length:153 start_codon:yes stop_codon:yes gene_type:complete